MAVKNETWCVLPWVHVCVRPDGALKPCCRYTKKGEFGNETMDALARDGISVMDAPDFVDLRKRMLNGEKSEGCVKCDRQDDYSDLTDRTSLRSYSNQKFPGIRKVDCDTRFDQIRYIEMSIDNICNLQCKICTSYFSSKLAPRDKFLGLPVHKKLEPNFRKFNNLDIANLEWLKILGGEPLMTPNLEPFLDYIDEKATTSNIVLELVTNGTVIPSPRVLEKLNRFKHISLLVSLDAYDPSNDYQRFGSSYMTTFSNARSLETLLSNSELAFHSATSVITANHLSKTLNHITKEHGYHMSIDFVRDPEYLSLSIAPPSFLGWVLDRNRDNHTAYRMIETVAANAKFSELEWKALIEFINKTDAYYNTNIKDYNPELYDQLSGYLGR